jgi:hypothetical protein
VNSISELTNNKVQDIIEVSERWDNFSEHNDNNNTDVEEVSSHMTEISARGFSQNSSDDSKEVSPNNSLEAEDDYYKMILKDCAKDCVYFDKEIDSTSQSVEEMNRETVFAKQGETNEIKSDDENNFSDSEDEMPDDSDDDDGYNGYGGYNEYSERDRGYYYCDRGYERKTFPMMSPIVV